MTIQPGCYVDGHHYAIPAMIALAVGYGFIIDPFAAYALSLHGSHNGTDGYPSEALYDLASEAETWLNSAGTCFTCEGKGYTTRRVGSHDQQVKCGACHGTKREDRMPGQNYPPIIPDGHTWEWYDGDFGLYTAEKD